MNKREEQFLAASLLSLGILIAALAFAGLIP